MHARHLVGCAVAIGLALALVVLTGGSIGGVGLLVAALACPIAMVLAMKLIMGRRMPSSDPRKRQGRPDTRKAGLTS